MLNSICVMGRFVKDPELRNTPSGTPVCSFTIACDRDMNTGEEKTADIYDCVAWRAKAEYISKYFRKGQMVAVIGSMHSRKWVDRNNNNRLSWEISVSETYFADKKENVPGSPVFPTNVPADDFDTGGEIPF